jgi:hypothetical protein
MVTAFVTGLIFGMIGMVVAANITVWLFVLRSWWTARRERNMKNI